MMNSYDIIVVGGGHAGCEAAMAASRMGSSVLLISMDMNKFGQRDRCFRWLYWHYY